jgi:putative ABC transport system permease protein
MILKFSNKIIKKEWRSLMLPFLSIVLTGAVITTSFLLINSARDFIAAKNKEFLGGDISYSSSKPFDVNRLINFSNFKTSNQIIFSGLVSVPLSNGEGLGVGRTSGASFKVMDDNYPLYGSINLQNDQFESLKENEVYVDENLYKNLFGAIPLSNGEGLGVGPALGDVVFNNQKYIIKDIIKNSPESLLGGFSFTGTLLMSEMGLEKSGADLNLFRKEYVTKVRFLDNKKLNKAEIESLRQTAREQNVRGQFDGSGQGGISFGLDIVERFLMVTILVISILSLVNIYASVNYLANRLRRSFAILIAIGLNTTSIYKILLLINSFVIVVGTALGVALGFYTAKYVEMAAEMQFGLPMFLSTNYTEFVFIFLGIFLTSIFATLPVINRLRGVSPRELLSHGERQGNRRTTKNILFDVLIGILPITLAAMYLLESVVYGLVAVVGVIFVYGGLMLFYYFFVDVVYRNRNIFPFSLKLITAQKKFDGFFGLITFASLFVALTSVYNLSILRTSIEEYLRKDLTRTLPSTYILDVQKSQQENLLANFPAITLFPNVRARIVEIDGLNIQKELENKNASIDRELGREFNLTYRDYLLSSEKLIQGNFANLKTGEVSLEKSFADRANIKMGSSVKFLIQGFEIVTTVTSIREADTRSGLPFFYFILSPDELSQYPATFFGYANFDTTKQGELKNYLAENLPNVSIIDTSAITKVGEELINILLLIILIITIPPIVLSSMLIVTILSSLSKDRKRDGARLMALGKENKYVRNFYILESTSSVVLASGFAYVFALVLSNFVILEYLKIKNLVYFDFISFYIFIFILFGIILVSVLLWRKGNKSLREYLNYEENN